MSKIDYLSWTLPHQHVGEALAVAGVDLRSFGDAKAGHTFRKCRVGPFGVRVYLDPSDGSGLAYVQLPGRWCAANQDLMQIVVAVFLSFGSRSTRADVAWDGFPLSPRECMECVERGLVKSPIHRATMHLILCAQRDIGKSGDTFYAGGSGSARRLRVYDRRGPVRCEVQCREWAAVSAVDMMQRGSDLRALLPIEFDDPSFMAWRGSAMSVRAPDVRVGSETSAVSWIRSQCMPTLAALRAMGYDLDSWISDVPQSAFPVWYVCAKGESNDSTRSRTGVKRES